jgi:hypothetical protein
MSDWLDPVRAALDADRGVTTFFFRNDDAGWEQPRLLRLLDLFARSGAPVDVATIPGSLTPQIAADLRRMARAAPGLVEVHQHGFKHRNHEMNGRRSEFGPSRAVDDQRRDLAHGKRLLEDMVGECVRPIFTPPWNRCTETTVHCLKDLGFAILSRDASAGIAGVPGVAERPVTLDWCGRRGVRLGLAGWAQEIAGSVGGGSPVGIMLHHAVMTDDDLRPLSALLRLLSRHPRARLRTIWRL